MVLCGINPVFTGLSPTHGQVTYALLTRAPLATRGAAARLACVRPVASVHPEPGSNSSLYYENFCLAQDHPVVFLFRIERFSFYLVPFFTTILS